MRAVVVTGPGAFETRTVPDPVPDANDVVVAVRATGICGTDIHLIDGTIKYDSIPVVPGHEFFGEIVAVGSEVDPRRVGALVSVDPNIACGKCAECRRGRRNLCLAYQAIGVTRDGACAEFAAVPEALVYDLPRTIVHDAAMFIEPIACAVRGFDLLPRYTGDRYLIYGAGSMGLLMGLLAAELSDGQVQLVEPNPHRREIAAKLGLSTASHADELDADARWESVIDCSGVISAIEDGVARVARGGYFQCFGVADSDALAKIRPFDIYRNEITIVGSMAVHNSFDRAVRLAERWGHRLTGLITHRYSVDAYATAIQTFREGSGLKIAIDPMGAPG